MNKNEKHNYIAKRVAQELKDHSIVNLGIGLPTKVANFIPENMNIHLQSENGFIGLRAAPTDGKIDETIVNAGGEPASINLGGCFFDSSTSFGIIRGGHVDLTVLGALQVDEKGNIANYMIPGKMVPGMGGAMDLINGARKVIVAMDHTAKSGAHKILKACTLPLTAVGAVNLIVTEMGVIEVTDAGLKLIEMNPLYTIEQIKVATEADLLISDEMIKMM